MLTLQIPTLLALLGTALMAVVIFAPERAAAGPTISYAPPPSPIPSERWWPASDPFAEPAEVHAVAAPTWPASIDPRAAACDASARLALVEALATVRAPWARTILQRALADEPDQLVRGAVAAALEA